MDVEQRQRVYGWYEEEDGAGGVTRVPYEFWWHLIFPWEIGPLLEGAGFDVVAVEGGYDGVPYTAASPTLFVTARSSYPSF